MVIEPKGTAVPCPAQQVLGFSSPYFVSFSATTDDLAPEHLAEKTIRHAFRWSSSYKLDWREQQQIEKKNRLI